MSGAGPTNSALLERIAYRHKVPAPASWQQPWHGATSRVYPCGDVVIKIAMASPDAAQSVRIDAAVNPVARELGVQVPELLAFDDSGEIVPEPYAIYRRVRDGVPLGELVASPDEIARAWDETGRNLALVHAVAYGTALPITLREFRQSPEVDPRPWVDEVQGRGLLEDADAMWLRAVLSRLAPAALADGLLTLCHGDVNASNILVSPRDGVTVIDWSGSGWLDPVWDFVGVPFSAVPHLLAGHRAVSPLPDDATAEARILWCQLQIRLYNARNQDDDNIARAWLARDIPSARAFAAEAGLG